MTDKLSKDELLEELGYWRNYCLKNCVEIHCIEGIEKCRQASQQIKEMIQKSQITEEWIDNFVEEKAKEFIARANVAIQNPEAHKQQLNIAKDFIRSLVEELADG